MTSMSPFPRHRAQPITENDQWREYERRKAALPKHLTPKEYEREIARITREMGI